MTDQRVHNMSVCGLLESESPLYADWEITADFYAGFWEVPEYCRSKGVEIPSNRRQTADLLADLFESRHEPYKKSSAISWRARYKGRDGVDEKHKENALKYYNQILAAIRQGRRAGAGRQ